MGKSGVESAQTLAVNHKVADTFESIADLLELEEANRFRVRAYRNAAREIRGLGRDIAAMVVAGEDLSELPGIGDDLAGKIREIVVTGESAMLGELHQRWPAGLHELLHLPGLGPKRVRALNIHLGVRGPADLAAAAQAGKVRTVPGLGARLEDGLKVALAGSSAARRLALVAVHPQAEQLVAHLQRTTGVLEIVIAGSYRRACATVGDLDLLVIARPRGAAISALVTAPGVVKVLARGSTRAAVVLRSGLQVDLRVVASESFGAALHYFTGSKAHNIAVRGLALARGLKLNEYGVFRGERRVAGSSEVSVFSAVGLPFIAPELREGRGEIEAAQTGQLPRLIAAEDLRGDLVVVRPDDEVEAVVDAAGVAARARGQSYLCILHEVTRRSHRDWAARLGSAARAAAAHNLEAIQALEADASTGPWPPTPARAHFAAARVVLSGRGPGVRLSGPRSAAAPPLVRVLVRGSVPAEKIPTDWLQGWPAGTIVAVTGDPAQHVYLEPLLRRARGAGMRVFLGSGGESGSSSNLDLAIGQARRAWIDLAAVVNAAPAAELRAMTGPTLGLTRAFGRGRIGP